MSQIFIKSGKDNAKVIAKVIATQRLLAGTNTTFAKAMTDIVDESTLQNFRKEGRPPWKPRTYKGKGRKNYTWPILRKTEKLLVSTITSIRRGFKRMGTWFRLDIYSIEYGIYHQEGRGQVRRRYLNLTDGDKKKLRDLVKRVFTNPGKVY